MKRVPNPGALAIPYGSGSLPLTIPEGVPYHLAIRGTHPGVADPVAEVEGALDAPLGGVRLEHFRGRRWAVIVINDKTRPVPNAVLLPPLVRRLEALGLGPERTVFLVATGSHEPMSPEQASQLLPPGVRSRYRVISHDASQTRELVDLGRTAGGTPVAVNRRYVQADLRIVTGNIEPHQFVGFSGAVKTAVVGLGSLPFINANHAQMTHPRARAGVYEGNPVREEIEEAGRLVGVDFALNSVLNGHGEIVRVLAGEPRAVQEAGVELSRELHFVRVPERADIIVSSPGGHPKDLDMYQAQKGLSHAVGALKEGGTVILVAECREGSGSTRFEAWMEESRSPEEVCARFDREGFRIGYHKAFQIARDMLRARVLLVSSLPPPVARRWHFTPADSLDQALAAALEHHGPEASVIVMPRASSTVVRIDGAAA